MLTLGICLVPYISVKRHMELALESIRSLVVKKALSYDYVKLSLVVNHGEESDMEILVDTAFEAMGARLINASVTYNDKNCLSRAWNTGIQNLLAEGCDYVLCPNLDIIASPNAIQNLVQFAIETGDDGVLWTGMDCTKEESTLTHVYSQDRHECPNFSFFLVSKTLFEIVGRFDEQFEPAYFEDNDMHQRILRAGKKAYATTGSRFFHYASQTLKNDVVLRQENNTTFENNKKKYIAKWGGLPGHETR